MDAQTERAIAEELKAAIEVQGSSGNWNHDPYMHGMYNGMELMKAIFERRSPVFKEAPEKWGEDKKVKEKLLRG